MQPRRHRPLALTVSAVTASALAALAVAGCGASQPATPAEPGLPNGSWQLASGTGPHGKIETADAHRITLFFEDGRIGGTAACNPYGASAPIDGDHIEVGDLVQTEMACEPPVMAAEAGYLGALRRVEMVRRDGERLVLAGPSVELRFEPLPPVPTQALLYTTWELETVVSGEVASSALRPPATLRLDGASLVGETGCRTFTGRFVVSGEAIRVTELAADDAATAGVCPPAAVGQERVVLQVLGDGFRAEVDGDRLTLTSRGGDRASIAPATPGEPT